MATRAALAALLLVLMLSGHGGGGGGGGAGGGWGGGALAQHVAPCTFNSMCTCKLGGGGPAPVVHLTTPRSLELVKDISCIGVPFAKMPEVMGSVGGEGGVAEMEASEAAAPAAAQVAHMDVVSAGLESLEGDALAGAQVESLRLMSNRIQLVGERAFASMADALKSLDLSYNELDHVPFDALRPLKGLDWLNLHSNRISSLSGGGEGAALADWGPLRESLSNLFLGENDLVELPPSHHDASGSSANGVQLRSGAGGGNGLGDGNGVGGGDGNGVGGGGGWDAGASLADCRQLTWLNVDSNKLSSLEAGALPPSLQTLSASHNLLARFPAEALDPLRHLSSLHLRGNYLDTLPHYTFHHRKHLERLDLAENALQSLPAGLFNNSLTVRDLLLEYNYLSWLPAQAFRWLNAARLYLAMNRLNGTDERAFVGLSHTLEYLDLEHNELRTLPRSLALLKRLKFLYAPGNRIARLDDDALDGFAASLRALSLSGNELERVPRGALRDCRRLSHLNLGYNRIYELEADDLARWAGSLDTLVLRNNRLARLDAHLFRYTPRLRELSLSFNKLSDVHPDAFADLADSLQSLEISFGLYREDFPHDFLKPLTALQWLALDNNNIRSVPPNALYTFGRLQYLNLDANRIESLSPEVFHPNVHKNLRDVRLSYNHLAEVESDTFSGMESLQMVVLTGNRIQAVRTNAFHALPNLLTLVLSDNRIATLEPRCFSDLPNLVKLDLQNNELREFSLNALWNATSASMPLSVNLSRNAVAWVHAGDTGAALWVKALDVSHNRVSEAAAVAAAAQRVAASLRRLRLAHNRIARLDASALGPLERLEVLDLEHNALTALAARAFAGLRALQLLRLPHNQLEALPPRAFADLPALRLLHLAHNRLRSLSRDAFQGTRLELLDLSYNEFVVMPSAALGQVGASLRYLELAHNHIEHLDSTMFADTPFLLGLSLAHNRLTILPDNVFTGLGALLRLDLGGNPLRANFKELFHYVQRLRQLSLAETGLRACPPLPLPNLVALNLSANAIEEVAAGAVEGLERLRSLDLSANRLRTAPAHAWPRLRLLSTLDLSRNPIKLLTKESFAGLGRLQSLSLQGLARLERFDADALARLRLLSSLRIQTWPRIDKYRFRLGALLSSLPALRRLSVHVLEPALTDQLINAFSPKLRQLEITGEALRSVAADALDGVEANYELALSFRGTQLAALPAGLFARLHRVPHLSLDLSDNRFSTLSPATLYPNGSSWESVGTKLFSGGLVLKGNPWTCDCGLVWLGHWLRRWLRETLQIHTAVLEGAQQMQELARQATCADARTGQRTPLLELRPEALSCHASALSRGGAPALRARPLPWLVALPLALALAPALARRAPR